MQHVQKTQAVVHVLKLHCFECVLHSQKEMGGTQSVCEDDESDNVFVYADPGEPVPDAARRRAGSTVPVSKCPDSGRETKADWPTTEESGARLGKVVVDSPQPPRETSSEVPRG